MTAVRNGIFLILFSFFAFSGIAQDAFGSDATEGNRFKAGVKLGITASQIQGDGYSGFNKAGLIGGGFVYTAFSEHVLGQMEINFVQKGSRDPLDPDNGKFTSYRIHMNYMEVPLLLKFKYKKFLFELGPSFGVLINYSEEDHNGSISPSQSLFDFKSTETAVNFGANFELSEKLTFNARFTHSLLPIANDIGFIRLDIIGGSYSEVSVLSLHYQFVK